MAAICLKCGSPKSSFDAICPACGHVSEGEGLLVAWLLSDAHLSPPELHDAAERIRRGLSPRPSARMLDTARRQLRVHVEEDPGLGAGARLGLLALSLLVTPAPGLAMAWTWWQRRPRAARQALGLSLPTGALVSAWLWSRLLLG